MMASMTLLNSSSLLAKATSRVVSSRKPVLCQAKSALALSTPKRLKETGTELWFHGWEAPAYLDGSLPGDRGFDPLRLAEITPGFPGITAENRLGWFLEAELYNGRVAMLAVVGILVTEYLGKGPWWEAPWSTDYAPLLPDGVIKYIAVTVVGHAVFASLEYKRWQNFLNKGQAGHFGAAPFDPIGLADDYKRQSEVRNGRLAMLAILGFGASAAATGKGPIAALQDHLADPTHNNALTNGQTGAFTFAFALAFGLVINVIGFAGSKGDAKVRTYFTSAE